MKRLTFILILCLTTLAVKAQFGLSASVRSCKSDWAVLSAYTGLELQLVDTLYFDSEYHIQYGPMLPTGMYQFETDDFALEFLSVGKPLQFVMNRPDDLSYTTFVSSPENEKWLSYGLARASYRQHNEALKSVLRQYDPNSDFYILARNEYEKLQNDYQHFTDSLIAHADDYASRLIKADRELPADLSMSGQEQRNYLIENWFREVDFNDLTLIPTNVLTTKMIDYLSLFQGLDGVSDPNLAFALGLDRILDKAKVNMKMYEFVLEYMLKGFTALGMDAVTDYLLNYPQLGEGDITMEEGLRLDSIAEPFQKVRVGVKAPDASGITIDGKPYCLYDSQAEYAIVFFWSTDCEYCHDFLTSLRKHLDLNTDFELVTFAISESQKEVARAVKKMKLPGYHFYEPERWEGDAFKNYHIFSTPTVFLLDSEKTIVCKPYDWHELQEWLNNNK